ncbi:MAG: LacI family DNA-binding transcriptional regulator [Fimbriimonadaceae bacterium]|nr:LacI family DNA-binding transcriptional regulator [Fimbriimonadaceae bacterium]
MANDDVRPLRRVGATLKDIATVVGVNPTTVAVVLNNTASGTRVSAKTREAILTAANNLGYRPNLVAQSLRRGRTNQIGLYNGYEFLDVRNPFLGSIVAGTLSACSALGLDLVIHTTSRNKAPETIIQAIYGGRLDGVIVVAPPSDPVGQTMDAGHLPALALGDPVANLPCVVGDDYDGGRQLARALLARGHRRVLFRSTAQQFASVDGRRNGLQDGLIDGGGELVLTPAEAPRVGEFTGAEWAALRGPDACTAIACWEDESAYKTIDALIQAGYQIPRDLAVTGYDGCELPVRPFVKLATVDAAWPEIAKRTVKLLHERISGADVPTRTVCPVKFLPGDTL